VARGSQVTDFLGVFGECAARPGQACLWALIDANPDDAELRQAFAAWSIDETNDQAATEALR
jgi:hypothetical protein